MIKYFVLVLILLSVFILKVDATKIPQEIKDAVLNNYPKSNFRIDGGFETANKRLFLPVAINTKLKLHNLEINKISEKGSSELFRTNSELIFLEVIKNNKMLTIIIPHNLPQSVQQQLKKSSFESDLIVPDNFILPYSLKYLVKTQPIKIVEDSQLKETTKQISKQTSNSLSKVKAIFLTSPVSGKIVMLDFDKLNKLSEFQTEGAPSCMTYFNSKILISDQAKNRILILDPISKNFVDQINLPKASAPKGIASQETGNYFYVAESGSNNIDVIEYATKKILLKTKVPSSPGKLFISPDGRYIIVLNTSVGAISILTSLNQRLLCSIIVGKMPNFCSISCDSMKAYVTNRISNNIAVVDIPKHRVVSVIPTGNAPTGIALTKKNIFVACAKDSKIQVFSLSDLKLVNEIKLPPDIDFPGSLKYLEENNQIIVTSESTEDIGIIDVNSQTFSSQKVIGFHTDDVLAIH